jgi:hypothetical protein
VLTSYERCLKLTLVQFDSARSETREHRGNLPRLITLPYDWGDLTDLPDFSVKEIRTNLIIAKARHYCKHFARAGGNILKIFLQNLLATALPFSEAQRTGGIALNSHRTSRIALQNA